MKIAELQQQIKEREDKIARIQQSKTGFEQQLGMLRTEEHSLIVSARTGDEAAKTRLSQIRQDVKTAEREIQDDAAAIAEITRELDQLRTALAREQNEATRQKLLREVSKFAKRAEEARERIIAAAAELREVGDTCTAEAESLRKLVMELDGDVAVNGVAVAAISVRAGLTTAADIIQRGPHSLGYDCLMHMGRLITALKSVTRDIEHKAETVSA